jgi:ubiquitin fusion degradation protein 1
MLRFGAFRVHCPLTYDSPDLEHTGQILLPENILNDLLQQFDPLPEVMTFSITNTRLGIVVYAGVQAFRIDPGHVCIPYWMMEFLQTDEGSLVEVATANLPLATRALFQPPDDAFLGLLNPRVILEYHLRSYPCLTQGTVIVLHVCDTNYRLKILKTEPVRAVATLCADVECDFATPISEFQHHWYSSDTDSSYDEDEEVLYGRTCEDRIVRQAAKPRRPNFAERERQRAKQRATGQIVMDPQIDAGPPKPKEERKRDRFKGGGRNLRGEREGGGEEEPSAGGAFEGPSYRFG